MGRQTALLFYRSYIEEESGKNIPKMNFWSINKDKYDELVSYLKQFSNTSVKYVILDSLSGGELCYVIRATVSDNIIVVIEVMNFDASTTTARVELTFDK